MISNVQLIVIFTFEEVSTV